MNAKRGFTLIEILVVLLIIGITMSFALVAFGDFGGSRQINVSAEQFANYIRLVQQQAILEANTLGIKVNQQGYQVFRFTEATSWKPMPIKGIFHIQHFPKSMHISYEGKPANRGAPDIIIDASGGLTPFKYHFGTQKHNNLQTVFGTHNGLISIAPITSS